MSSESQNPEVIPIDEVLDRFRAVSRDHIELVKEMRTRIAPDAVIELAHGDTEK